MNAQAFTAALIKRTADKRIAAIGVKHGKLTVTSSGGKDSSGKDLPS